MDKESHIQIDRIEMKTDKILNDLGIMNNIHFEDVIVEFIENEIFNEKGKLKHLKKDPKINEYFKELTSDEDEDEDEIIESDEKDEYGQKQTK